MSARLKKVTSSVALLATATVVPASFTAMEDPLLGRVANGPPPPPSKTAASRGGGPPSRPAPPSVPAGPSHAPTATAIAATMAFIIRLLLVITTSPPLIKPDKGVRARPRTGRAVAHA